MKLIQHVTMSLSICDSLHDLIPFVECKKHETPMEEWLLLIKLQAKTCNLTKSNTPPWVFFSFF